MKFNGNDYAEFRGQIIDIFEDYFEEVGITLTNADKEAAIKDGADPNELAIIYGEDYDFILSDMSWYIGDDAGDHLLTKEHAVAVINCLIEGAQSLILTQRSICGAEYAALAAKIKETLHNWDLLAAPAEFITISCRIESESDLDYLSKHAKGNFYIVDIDKNNSYEPLEGWALIDIKKDISLDSLAFLEGDVIRLGTDAYQAIEFADIGHFESFERQIEMPAKEYANGHSIFMFCGASKEDVISVLKYSPLSADGIHNFSYNEETKTARFDTFSKYPGFCGLEEISGILENSRVYAVNDWEWHDEKYPIYAYKNGAPIDLTGEFIPSKEDCFVNDSTTYRFEATYTDSNGEAFTIWNMLDINNKNALNEVLVLCPGLKDLDSYKDFLDGKDAGTELS